MSSAALVAELRPDEVEGEADRDEASASAVLARLRGVEDEGAEEGEADRSCCSRSFSSSPLRMYLLGGATAADIEALVDGDEGDAASAAALRLFAISALRKSILVRRCARNV